MRLMTPALAAVVAENERSLAPLELVAIPAELREAWERAVSFGHNEQLTRALYRVALGESYRDAAEAEGYEDHKQVWRAAKRHGLVQAKKEKILDGTRRIALLANGELERRLVEKADDVATRDLIVASGVAQDKLAAAENWSKSADKSAYGTGLERVIQQAIDAGATFKLEVTGPESGERHPDLPEREEIDVTPGRGEAL